MNPRRAPHKKWANSLLLVALVVGACGGPAEEAGIRTFEPLRGAIESGAPATASARIQNTGAEEHTFWVGYSVQDATGEWHDAPPRGSVQLAAGEESDVQDLSTEPLTTPGYYNARLSVWDEEPGDGARRLADVEENSPFRVYSEWDVFDGSELDSSRWEAPGRELGRGEISPENIDLQEGRLRLTLPANTLNGGEVESKTLYGPGFYAARIKVPNAPSSITGFFLYAPPDFESEIDVEVFNDTSGKVMFTTYADGEQTNHETITLPFDPTADFHDYAFFYDEDSIIFYVDGEPVQEYEGGLPTERMNLYVNSWFPEWLDGEEPDEDRYAYVDWIEH